ncbi:endonuclease [Candidatus Gracilibacteria bacterium]|nr:MAG: endonuclease [Candidatus Gracilibacteria bacterium]
MTEPEKKLWFGFFMDFQKIHKIRVLRQRIIDNFIVDFYIPKAKIVVEVDGESHFTENGKIYDEERANILNGLGLKVIRFTNLEIGKNFDGVCESILLEIGKNNL